MMRIPGSEAKWRPDDTERLHFGDMPLAWIGEADVEKTEMVLYSHHAVGSFEPEYGACIQREHEAQCEYCGDHCIVSKGLQHRCLDSMSVSSNTARAVRVPYDLIMSINAIRSSFDWTSGRPVG